MTGATIRPEDESFHPHAGDPYWNESCWIPFNIPERSLGGWVYFFHRPYLGVSIGGIAAWDPSGEETYDCLWHDWGAPLPTPPGSDMFDFALPNGLTVQCREPLTSYRITYRNDSCALDLEWDSVREPYVYPHGFAGVGKEWGPNHYEQLGRAVGTLRVDGQVFEVDCWSNRDRTWGQRRVVRNPRGDFPWAVASENHAFHLTCFSPLEPAQDPIDGVTDPVLYGWYLRDGEIASLTGGTRVLERGRGGRPLRIVVDAMDDMNRQLQAEGRCVNWLKWDGFPVFNSFALTEWTFGGDTGWGEVQDFFNVQQLRQFLRRAALSPNDRPQLRTDHGDDHRPTSWIERTRPRLDTDERRGKHAGGHDSTVLDRLGQ